MKLGSSCYQYVYQLHELTSGVDKGLVRDIDALIIAIEHIEELGEQFHFETTAKIQPA
jgi:hypothetical protein